MAIEIASKITNQLLETLYFDTRLIVWNIKILRCLKKEKVKVFRIKYFNIYIYIYKGLFQDVKLEGLEFRAYALISFKTSSK